VVRTLREWIKIKNMGHPAIERAMLIALSKRTAATRAARKADNSSPKIRWWINIF
jgi:hypothetical protein